MVIIKGGQFLEQTLLSEILSSSLSVSNKLILQDSFNNDDLLDFNLSKKWVRSVANEQVKRFKGNLTIKESGWQGEGGDDGEDGDDVQRLVLSNRAARRFRSQFFRTSNSNFLFPIFNQKN